MLKYSHTSISQREDQVEGISEGGTVRCIHTSLQMPIRPSTSQEFHKCILQQDHVHVSSPSSFVSFLLHACMQYNTQVQVHLRDLSALQAFQLLSNFTFKHPIILQYYYNTQNTHLHSLSAACCPINNCLQTLLLRWFTLKEFRVCLGHAT